MLFKTQLKNKLAVSLAILTLCVTDVYGGCESRGNIPDASKYPLIFGMNIGQKNYDDETYQSEMARLDALILGFYPGWKGRNGEEIQDVLKALKRKNPTILLGQYTVLNEAYDDEELHSANRDKKRKLDKEQWWLLDENGNKVQWTDRFSTWETNFTRFAKRTSEGQRYNTWLANRDYELYYSQKPYLDLWYFDNVFLQPRIKYADWDKDGVNEEGTSQVISVAMRIGHAEEWEEVRRLCPNILLIGNVDNDLSSEEYRGMLDGAFLEGAMGKTWSLESRYGWDYLLERYYSVLENVRQNNFVVLNVWGSATDYQKLRYALGTALLGGGYFSYTDQSKGYSSVPWFDEYENNLGHAVEPRPEKPWSGEVYKREFENGIVLVNPSNRSERVMLQKGYRRIKGEQASTINNGEVATRVVLKPKDGLILIRTEDDGH